MMKMKDTMVRYTLVPDSEGGNTSSHCSRCPKFALSKTKIFTFVVISIVAIVILIVTVGGPNVWTYAANVTECFVDKKCKSGRKSVGKDGTHANTNTNRDDKLFIKRFPQALIIGARKGGTRALLRFLSLHQHVIVSKHETHFFDRNYDKGYDWYVEQMPESYPLQITLEKTPNYLVDWNVPERVFVFNSSIKLLLILRNPIDRAVSDYIQLKVKEKDPSKTPSFEQFVIDPDTGEINKSYSPIKRSLYCRHLEKWLAYFDKSQILIIDGENIKVRPWEEMYKVEEFLGVSHEIEKSKFVFNATKGFYCLKVKRPHKPWKVVERCLSPAKGRVHPELDPVVQRKLEEFFRPYNERLFEMIGRSFDWF